MTWQGMDVWKENGVYEFLVKHREHFDSFVTISLNSEESRFSERLAIHHPLSHPVIQKALVSGELNLDKQSKNRYFTKLLCETQFLAALNECPELLGQAAELDSKLSNKSLWMLLDKNIQRMLATKMLTLKQLNQITITPDGITMKAEIIIDAAARKAIPTDMTIGLTNIEFGSLPGGRLTLPDNIRLTSCSLDSGVLKVGKDEWQGGPLKFSSQ